MPVPVSDIVKELEFLSDLLSTRVRTIAFSILALVWLFLAGGASSPVLPVKPDGDLLLCSGALALGSLIADYLQYVIGYFATDAVRREAEKNSANEADYDYTDPLYRVRTVCFWLKQALMAAALVCLATAIFQALF